MTLNAILNFDPFAVWLPKKFMMTLTEIEMFRKDLISGKIL